MIDLFAAGFVRAKYSEWWRIDVDRNEVALANVWVTKLMNIGNVCPSHFTRKTLTSGVITKPARSVVMKDRFPKDTLLHEDSAV